MSAGESTVGIGVLYPELLGTYGDGGNAVILAQRLRWRAMAVEVVEVRPGDPIPDSLDLYVLGGGEDGPQALAASELHASGALHRAVGRGAAVLAVCAGLQILGERFVGLNKVDLPGLGLVDAITRTGEGPRRVGELVGRPVSGLDLPLVTGYENHQGDTILGPQVSPLSRLSTGVGNEPGTASDGFWVDRIIGTYCHGPVLARNPEMADRLLGWATGAVLAPLDDTEAQELRRERLAVAHDARRSRSWWRRRLG